MKDLPDEYKWIQKNMYCPLKPFMDSHKRQIISIMSLPFYRESVFESGWFVNVYPDSHGPVNCNRLIEPPIRHQFEMMIQLLKTLTNSICEYQLLFKEAYGIDKRADIPEFETLSKQEVDSVIKYLIKIKNKKGIKRLEKMEYESDFDDDELMYEMEPF